MNITRRSRGRLTFADVLIGVEVWHELLVRGHLVIFSHKFYATAHDDFRKVGFCAVL